jgi:AraC-like DNA-binding protein
MEDMAGLEDSGHKRPSRQPGNRLEQIGDGMGPVLAQTTGFFRERPAAGGLADAFCAVWVHRLDERAVPPIVITPDATIDLQWIDGRFRVAGPDKEPQIETLSPGAVIVAARLDIDELWGTCVRALTDRLKAAPDLDDLVRQLEETVGKHTEGRDALDWQMSRAFEIVDDGPPPETPLVPFLQRHLHMSERTLRRRFEDAFGYGPKTLDRILRFQRFRRLRRQQRDASAAQLAIEAGYADQAHLIRESRRLTGVTPSALA